MKNSHENAIEVEKWSLVEFYSVEFYLVSTYGIPPEFTAWPIETRTDSEFYESDPNFP